MAGSTRRICSVEGVYGYGDSRDEPSIKPMLELLPQWGYWPHVWERCRTVGQMELFLADRWAKSGQTDYGSVLYFASHGSPGSIQLSDRESIDLRSLARTTCLWGQCVGCYVHFSACNVLEDRSAVDDFLGKTGAAAVSGYRTDVGWAESEKPALPLDLMLFNHLWEQLWEAGVNRFDAPGAKAGLEDIREDLQRRFADCEFDILFPSSPSKP